MWATPSYSLIILLICLTKVVEIRAQCERPLGGENMVLTDESGKNTFPEGSSLTFRCSTGYQPDQSGGSRSITCTGQQWSKLGLQCKKKSCGSPGALTHGRYLTPDGILFGAITTAECDEGYLLVGPKTRSCLDNGWDQRAAVCEAVKCLPPPTIQNGNFDPSKDSYDYNEAVTYSCTGDYTLIGKETITCLADGTFQQPLPQCLVIRCDGPRIDNAVRIEGKAPPYKYKDIVRYRCNDGYRMIGLAFLTCEVNEWNPSPPVCTAEIGPNPDPNPDPNPGPNPDPNPDPNPGEGGKTDHSRNIGIGIGVGILVALIAGIGVCYAKKRKGVFNGSQSD